MRPPDLIRLALGGVRAYRLRSLLTALGIAVGIAAVVLLTAIGEGVHRYVLSQFTQFGAHLIAVMPGKTSTFGVSGAMVNNVRPLSLEDAEELSRIPSIRAVVPVTQGNAPVEFGKRTRRCAIFGVGAATPEVWQIKTALGRFLPDDDPRYARPLAVLGSKLRRELFGEANPLGEHIRIGGESFRVVGAMESKGQMLGFDLDDAVYIPTHRAMALFDQSSLMEVDLLYAAGAESEELAQAIKERLKRRHGGEDFTIITQDQMLSTLGSILDILTLAVGALGGISLLVGGVGILTIMTIAVHERRGEVGLLRALGALQPQILGLFLAEAMLLSLLGGLAGILLGTGGAWLIGALVPALPTHIAWQYLGAAAGISLLIGLLAGIAPAWRAARMDPIEALREE